MIKPVKFVKNQLDEVSQYIITQSKHKIICLYGEMGAGKTTLVKAILKNLGATDLGNSPSFGIVNEYHDENDTLLAYHFDFYRLNDEIEALDLGLEDYLNTNTWVFIEWPQKIASFLPENISEINIKIIDNSTREINII